MGHEKPETLREKLADHKRTDEEKQRAMHETPTQHARGFRCPHCGVIAHQVWCELRGMQQEVGGGPKIYIGLINNFYASECQACQKLSLWVLGNMVYPATSTAPRPVADMPEDVRVDYEEARAVFDRSARAAGGLLRTGFEKLLKHLGATKDKPNDAIGELVAKGLVLGPLQKAMDSLRVFSNQTVHDGFVRLDDQPGTVAFLFKLLNYVVEQMITRPREIEAMYNMIPQDKLDGIERRDNPKPKR